MTDQPKAVLTFIIGIGVGSVGAWWQAEGLPLWRDTRSSSLFSAPKLRPPYFPSHVTATAYCPCRACCGKWAEWGRTASGRSPVEGRTIAADWRVFPKGGCLVLGDAIGKRVVEDTGSAILGARVDVFFRRHEDARRFGVRVVPVGLCSRR